MCVYIYILSGCKTTFRACLLFQCSSVETEETTSRTREGHGRRTRIEHASKRCSSLSLLLPPCSLHIPKLTFRLVWFCIGLRMMCVWISILICMNLHMICR